MSKQLYLTPRQVAEMTGISLDTLARWRSRKQRVPYLKIGRTVRYERTEVLAYLERCRVPVSGYVRNKDHVPVDLSRSS